MSQEKERILNEERDWNKIDDAIIGSENFLMKYRNFIFIALAVILVIVGGYFAYQRFYVQPQTKEAQAAMFKGEQYFQMGADSLALYGDGNGYMGFESIAKEYSATKTGDLAKVYAGLSFAKLGNYEQALTYLQQFSGKDVMLSPAIESTIGDCLVNTGKTEDAVSHFVKAAKNANDILLSPIFYKKAALVYRDLGKYDDVIEMFTIIQNNYISSPEAMDADKYIEEATILKGNK